MILPKQLSERIPHHKECIAYLRMHKRHRKALIKSAKTYADFDFGYLHEDIVLRLRHMLEFYVAGNNVWQSRESHEEIIQTLHHALEIADRIENLWQEDEHIYVSNPTLEEDLYKEFYSYIGEHITEWWD